MDDRRQIVVHTPVSISSLDPFRWAAAFLRHLVSVLCLALEKGRQHCTDKKSKRCKQLPSIEVLFYFFSPTFHNQCAVIIKLTVANIHYLLLFLLEIDMKIDLILKIPTVSTIFIKYETKFVYSSTRVYSYRNSAIKRRKVT
ncbi:hypothetical protein T10_1771 [Trichinella papuae]|uniref:Uncharacterized protein n=1 Tax=Trichinella papuae TaxID=268474 RepID=A0A0V1M5A7_9BILA|nr:hypothetical protein T10_1771 [Trichinella papuae]